MGKRKTRTPVGEGLAPSRASKKEPTKAKAKKTAKTKAKKTAKAKAKKTAKKSTKGRRPAAISDPLRHLVGQAPAARDSGASGAFDPEGRRFAACGYGVHIWDVATGAVLATRQRGIWMSRSGIAFTPDGARVVLWGNGSPFRGRTSPCDIELMDARTGASAGRLAHPQSSGDLPTCALRVVSDQRAVSMRVDGTVCVWDLTRGTLTSSFTIDLGRGAIGCFSPDGASILVLGRKTSALWSVESGAERWSVSPSGVGRPTAGAIGPSGSLAVTAHTRGSGLLRWNLATGEHTTVSPASFSTLAILPGGERCVGTTSDGKQVHVIGLQDGRVLQRFALVERNDLAVPSPDGRLLVTNRPWVSRHPADDWPGWLAVWALEG